MEIVDVNTAINVHECWRLSESQVQKLPLTWIQHSGNNAIGAIKLQCTPCRNHDEKC